MAQNILIITEGSQTEPNIFEYVLPQYGFIVYNTNKKIIHDDLKETTYINKRDKVTIIQGDKNRIKDLFFTQEHLKDDYYSERIVLDTREKFSLIFIVYDVDHNSVEELESAYNRFCDETDEGLLILSCPCIEVLAEYDINRTFECNSFKKYKADLNVYYDRYKHMNTEEYIKRNFNSLILKFLDLNYQDFQESNIMEHPKLLIAKDKERNIRTGTTSDDYYASIRYFSTVIYVIIASVKKLTKEIDNYEIVRQYLLSIIEEKNVA